MIENRKQKTPLAIKIIAGWLILAGILNILLEEIYMQETVISYIILKFTEPLS